ncbi:MAG: DUF2975 domain-containing protein [Bacteroidia bacterium]|nr:DUF2975 domain-containing protein [Bacteroidia bacterium]
MKAKHYKLLSYFIGFSMTIFLITDIFKYLFLLKNLSEQPASLLIPQGVYVLGLLFLIAFYIVILRSVNKKELFVKRNERTFRYFGLIIFILAFLSAKLFDFMTGDIPMNVRWLGLLGGTLAFMSFIFQAGIKLQEEQELTI